MFPVQPTDTAVTLSAWFVSSSAPCSQLIQGFLVCLEQHGPQKRDLHCDNVTLLSLPGSRFRYMCCQNYKPLHHRMKSMFIPVYYWSHVHFFLHKPEAQPPGWTTPIPVSLSAPALFQMSFQYEDVQKAFHRCWFHLFPAWKWRLQKFSHKPVG